MFGLRTTIYLAGIALIAFLPSVWADGFDVSGIVTDAQGAPVAEASVWLSQDRVVRVGTTDAEGRFLFEDAQVAQAVVVVWKEGHALGGTEGHILDSVELTVQLAAPAQIRLRTTTKESEPISGARVQRMRIGDRFAVPVSDLVPYGFPPIRSDDEGYMVLKWIPEKSYASFVISHRAYANKLLPPLPVGTDDLDVPLETGVKVGGRVTNAAGEGVARTRVSLYRPRQEGGQVELAEVLTDREGFYSAILPPAAYFAAARHAGYAIPAPQAVVLEVGGEALVLDIELPDAHWIRGKTLDPDGAPVSQVLFQYVSGGAIYAEVMSDARGDFTVIVAAGEGVLYIVPPPLMMTTIYPQIPLRISEKREIDLGMIEVKPLPVITGTVTARAATNLDKVVIATRGADPPRWTVADEDGRFELQLWAMPPTGTVSLRAEHAHRFLRGDVRVDLDEADAVAVVLKPFTPDLSEANELAMNDLSDLVGEAAREWECDTWFNVPDEEGEPGTLSLESLRGKVVVLNLWGSFNRQGRGLLRLAELNSLHYLFSDVDDVVVVGVHDAGTDAEDVGRAVREFEIGYPVGRDADPFVTFTRYRVQNIPQTVLIDKDGVLRHYQVEGRLLELVKALRRQPQKSTAN